VENQKYGFPQGQQAQLRQLFLYLIFMKNCLDNGIHHMNFEKIEKNE